MKYFLKLTILTGSLTLCASLQADQARQLRIADPLIANNTITYHIQGGFAVAEGDIVIDTVDHIAQQGAVVTRKIAGSRWEHGIIPYSLRDDLPFANKLAVLEAIDHWQKHTFLEFIEVTSKNQDQYKDYITFIPSEGTTCSSYVGRKGGMQEINLSPRCTAMITVHEIGHALGLWHEQSRSDRDSYIRIIWDNIIEEYKDNFLLHLTDGKDFGEYDYQSIMHYGPYGFSKNGEKTIEPLVDAVEIGQRKHLSEKDIAAVKAMYPEL